MPIKVLMPALSPTMTEGNLLKWHKKEGDAVVAGDLLAEIETDKATMEVEAVDEGILGRITVPAGTQAVKVNQVIALLLEEGEDKAALDKISLEEETSHIMPPSQELHPLAAGTPSLEAASPQKETSERVFASPLARRMAEQKNVSLHQVQGSGPHGRIIKVDIESFKEKPASSTATAPSYSVAGFRDEPLSSMRKVIAQRLLESKTTVPHFYLTIDCEMDALLDIRQRLNEGLSEDGVKLSVNDFVIKAAALALMAVPSANVAWQGNHLRLYDSADISVAVSIEGGLITPIIKAAHLKGLKVISKEMKELALRARQNALRPDEFQGGTFSISNLGMYGIKEFAAIINPPQACILAVGASREELRLIEGDLAVKTLMSCTLSADHRAVDGAEAAQFLQAFKKFIENPLLLLA